MYMFFQLNFFPVAEEALLHVGRGELVDERPRGEEHAVEELGLLVLAHVGVLAPVPLAVVEAGAPLVEQPQVVDRHGDPVGKSDDYFWNGVVRRDLDIVAFGVGDLK